MMGTYADTSYQQTLENTSPASQHKIFEKYVKIDIIAMV
uniref:Uncharacterized protein n=1 Tax=Arundo donax TaxID=35708 RepID=A0A0A8ZUV7_ARUDO